MIHDEMKKYADQDLRMFTELSDLSSIDLLQQVLRLEDNSPSFPAQPGEEDSSGKNFSKVVEGAPWINETSVEEKLMRSANSRLHMAYEAFCDFVVESWDETWASCATSAFASMLGHRITAMSLALLAWKRHHAGARQSNTDTVWHQLCVMPPEMRKNALASFAETAAVSCAYEGIDIDPATLV